MSCKETLNIVCSYFHDTMLTAVIMVDPTVTHVFRYEMKFNLKTGQASQKRLSASAVDFPRVNESYTGRYNVLISAFRPCILSLLICKNILQIM